MKVFKIIAVVSILFAVLHSKGAFARTYAAFRHDFYSEYYNPNHIFGVYEAEPNYEDPDFNVGFKMSSPLYNPTFASYDVIVLINKHDVTVDGKVYEKAQRVRVYLRPEAAKKLPPGVLDFTNYNSQTGLLFYWKTSTARVGKTTRAGHFRVKFFSPNHFSSQYNLSPMPWAVFFNGGIASHGVSEKYYKYLGTPRSAGCARLESQRAKDLYHLIGMVGKGPVDRLYQTSARFVGKTTNTYKTLYIVRN